MMEVAGQMPGQGLVERDDHALLAGLDAEYPPDASACFAIAERRFNGPRWRTQPRRVMAFNSTRL
jgi:hypothetical protein